MPDELAAEMSHAAGVAVAAWDKAKAASDFASFVPHLERQLELKHRYIECFPQTDTPYDVLLDDYEEGMTTAEVADVFTRLKEELVPLIERGQRPTTAAAPRALSRRAGSSEASRRRARRVRLRPGSRWRIDETPHPFASKPGLGRHPADDAHRRAAT